MPLPKNHLPSQLRTTKLEQHANKLMTLHDEIADLKANFTVSKDKELPGSTRQMQAKFYLIVH